jgi:hypothetical protein
LALIAACTISFRRFEEIIGGTFFGLRESDAVKKQETPSETSTPSQSLGQESRRDSEPKEREEEVLFLCG